MYQTFFRLLQKFSVQYGFYWMRGERVKTEREPRNLGTHSHARTQEARNVFLLHFKRNKLNSSWHFGFFNWLSTFSAKWYNFWHFNINKHSIQMSAWMIVMMKGKFVLFSVRESVFCCAVLCLWYSIVRALSHSLSIDNARNGKSCRPAHSLSHNSTMKKTLSIEMDGDARTKFKTIIFLFANDLYIIIWHVVHCIQLVKMLNNE